MKKIRKLFIFILTISFLLTAFSPIQANSADEVDENYAIEIGSLVTFGKNPYSDGDLKWTVADLFDGKALLISDGIIGNSPFTDEKHSSTNSFSYGYHWEDSTLRQYLNGEFISNAFTAKEQLFLTDTLHDCGDNPEFDLRSTSPSLDKIFLLSNKEVVKYAEHITADGTYFLRTLGCKRLLIASANGSTVDYYGKLPTEENGVLIATVITLSNAKFTKSGNAFALTNENPVFDVADGNVNISAPGTYFITGEGKLEDKRTVNISGDNINVILDGVKISGDGSNFALEIKGNVNIVLQNDNFFENAGIRIHEQSTVTLDETEGGRLYVKSDISEPLICDDNVSVIQRDGGVYLYSKAKSAINGENTSWKLQNGMLFAYSTVEAAASCDITYNSGLLALCGGKPLANTFIKDSNACTTYSGDYLSLVEIGNFDTKNKAFIAYNGIFDVSVMYDIFYISVPMVCEAFSYSAGADVPALKFNKNTVITGTSKHLNAQINFESTVESVVFDDFNYYVTNANAKYPINFKGNVTVTVNGKSLVRSYYVGMSGSYTVTFDGEGTLDVYSIGQSSEISSIVLNGPTLNLLSGSKSIWATGDITVNSGAIDTLNTPNGIGIMGSITVNGGRISTLGLDQGIVSIRGNVTVNDGEIYAASKEPAIQCYAGNFVFTKGTLEAYSWRHAAITAKKITVTQGISKIMGATRETAQRTLNSFVDEKYIYASSVKPVPYNIVLILESGGNKLELHYNAYAGEITEVFAKSIRNYRFVRWECSQAEIEDVYADPAVFTMPEKTVTLRAIYEFYNGSSDETTTSQNDSETTASDSQGETSTTDEASSQPDGSTTLENGKGNTLLMCIIVVGAVILIAVIAEIILITTKKK